MKKYGFTLAEVLVTLMIIGVISALTIPAMRKVSQEQTYVTGAKKAISTLSGAFERLKIERGPVKLWGITDANSSALFMSQMNATTFEVPADYRMTFKNGDYYNLAGFRDQGRNFMTSDGMLFYSFGGNATCSKGKDEYQNACAVYIVDVNGLKDPNIVGIDIYAFLIKKTGVFPWGSDNKDAKAECLLTDSKGLTCSTVVLGEGKISW